jgi:hypothetical protein
MGIFKVIMDQISKRANESGDYVVDVIKTNTTIHRRYVG